MRILTVMSGVVLSATGAGCLAYYSSAFSSIAFVLGVVMIISAIFLLGAFLLSAKNRLPDTVLVEGMMTLIFGFVILNNEVADTVISLFFGAWLTVSGIIRFSQSLSVSRFDPKNWHKIMPLGIISAIFGFIMLMHSLISTWNQLTLVGITFMLNGFSQLIYAMYMIKHETLPQTEQARKRVEAKQRIAEEKRKERDSLRNLGKKEKEQRKEELREAQRIAALEKKKAIKEQKEKEKMEREALLEPTIRLTQKEEIQVIAETEPIKDSLPDSENKTDQEQEQEQEPEVAYPQPKEEQPSSPEQTDKKEVEPIISWDSLSKEPSWEHSLRQSDNDADNQQKVEEPINFQLPQKPDVTEILEKELKKPEPTSFKPLVLEELIEDEDLKNTEENKKIKEESDKRFTEEFSWDWPLKD